MGLARDEYIERVVGFLLPKDDPELARDARASLYQADFVPRSREEIIRAIRLAYLRGCRRGAAAAWSSCQPVTVRRFSRPFRPVVDLRALPYSRIAEPLDRILFGGNQTGTAFPWIFDEVHPPGLALPNDVADAPVEPWKTQGGGFIQPD